VCIYEGKDSDSILYVSRQSLGCFRRSPNHIFRGGGGGVLKINTRNIINRVKKVTHVVYICSWGVWVRLLPKPNSSIGTSWLA